MRKANLAALLLFVVLSLVLTYPLSFHLADAVEDRQDALLNVWITAWDGHQLLDNPLHLFDANIFYPYPRTLAYSELLLGNGLLALPITAAIGNPVLGYNLALLLSFVLSGFGVYLLVLRLTRSPGGGVVAGAIFAFSAFRMTNIAQAQLLTTQWLPFALLSLDQLLRRPRPRYLITFVLFFCLQALSSFYYAILLALAVAAFAVWHLLFERPATGERRSSVIQLLVAVLLCVLVILPFALPYFRVQRDLAFERTLVDNEPFSASLRQYLMVPPGSVGHGLWLPSDDTPIAGGYPVDALFPGIVAVALGVWGLIRGHGRTRWFFLVLLLVGFVLSLGPRLYLAPGQPSGLDLGLPYAWLYAIVPGFKALRAPARFDVLVMLSLAALAGYGIASFVDLKGSTRRFGLVLTGGLFLLVVFESLIWPAAQTERVPVGDDVPEVYGWLADRPAAPILELPMAFTPGGPRLDYQYFSTYHWHTTPDGYSGFIPPKHGQIVYEMERFPSERSVSLLQALDVRYVVLHSDLYSPEQWAGIKQELGHALDLRVVEIFGQDWVLEVLPRSFDPGYLQVDVYFPPYASVGQPYTAYVFAVNNGLRSYAVQPTDESHPAFIWNGPGNTAETFIRGDVPLVTSPHGGVAVIPLSVIAPTQPGEYSVAVGEQYGPLGTWADKGTVSVGEQGDGDFPVPVRLESGDWPEKARPGEPLAVGLEWLALGKIDAYYSIYVKLLDAGGNAIAGWDGQPQNGDAPTLLWVPGETIDDLVILTVPDDIPAGEYTLEVGMYRVEDMARCLTLNKDGIPVGSVMLGTVYIQP